MKPLYLEISGWGPYPGKNQIDFSKMEKGELFLITGPTGAGKTTIFDGITYALYGEVSGKMRTKDRLRSDFAPETVDTYVNLVFLHAGKQYRVERHPKYIRRKKRGEGFTTKKEDACLFLSDKNVICGISQVNEKIQEILGINYKQFKQLSMLAQGEFLDLLMTKSGERTEIFRSVFHTQIYQNVQELAGQKARGIKDEVRAIELQMEEALRMAESPEILEIFERKNFQEVYQLLKEKKVFFKKEKENLEEKKLGTEEKYNSICRFCEDIVREEKEIEKLKNDIDCLDKQEKSLKEKIYKKEKEYKETMLLQEEVKKWNKRVLFLEDAMKKAEEGKKIQQEKEALKISIKNQEDKVGAALFWEWKEAEEDFKRTEREKEKIEKEIEEESLHYKKLDNRRLLERRKQDCIQSMVYAANVGMLAAGLKEGVPCPVCGSMDHPKIAPIVEDVPDQNVWKIQVEKTKRIEEQFQKSYEKMIKLQHQKESIEQLLRQKEKQIPQKPEKIFRREDQLLFDKKKEKEKLKQMQQAYIMLCGRFEGLSKEVKDVLKEENKIQKEYEEKTTKIDQYEERMKKVGEEFHQIQMEYSKIMALENLERKKLEQKEEVFPSIQERKEKLEECRRLEEIIHVLDQKMKEQMIGLSRVEKACGSFQKKLKQKEKLEQKYGIIGDVDRLLNGNNRLRMNLEQYAMISYFQDVLKAANIRLLKMSAGRYEMYRQETVSDGRKKDHLEIEIFDAYTGKKRPVKTLSGGESFKAALCLALGLSDVIQSYAGGIQIDILFVDEGFGALDEESLHQAVVTLMELAGEHRMIGIISHVVELKEQIDKKIEVRKNKEGSYIYRS